MGESMNGTALPEKHARALTSGGRHYEVRQMAPAEAGAGFSVFSMPDR